VFILSKSYSLLKKWQLKNRGCTKKKCMCFTLKKLFHNFFFLFCCQMLYWLWLKNRKKWGKNCLHIKIGGERVIVYTFCGGYTYLYHADSGFDHEWGQWFLSISLKNHPCLCHVLYKFVCCMSRGLISFCSVLLISRALRG
jgi:hypothetical protein